MGIVEKGRRSAQQTVRTRGRSNACSQWRFYCTRARFESATLSVAFAKKLLFAHTRRTRRVAFVVLIPVLVLVLVLSGTLRPSGEGRGGVHRRRNIVSDI